LGPIAHIVGEIFVNGHLLDRLKIVLRLIYNHIRRPPSLAAAIDKINDEGALWNLYTDIATSETTCATHGTIWCLNIFERCFDIEVWVAWRDVAG
jgi:hypothetical protein